jgi:Tol biopolymer transport system component
MREELDEEEYVNTRKETIEQMKEFEVSLKRLVEGNVTLVDSVGTAQLAIQAAIRSSTSPDILNMFLKKENGALRSRLAGLDSDYKVSRITKESYETQIVEILVLLEKLKEPLSPVEKELLKRVVQLLSVLLLMTYFL